MSSSQKNPRKVSKKNHNKNQIQKNSEEKVMERWYEEATKRLVGRAEGKPSAKAAEEAHERGKQLSTSASQVGVSFGGTAFQVEYFKTKFARRGQLLYQVLLKIKEEEIFKKTDCLSVQSFGGGPGTDSAGAIWFVRHFHPTIGTLNIDLYDKEPTWKRFTHLLYDIFGMKGDDTLIFNLCDITVGVTDLLNCKCSPSHLARSEERRVGK